MSGSSGKRFEKRATRPNGDAAGGPVIEGLAGCWRADATRLRAWSCDDQATILERCADELEARVMEWADEPLTLSDAAQESGYSVQHLRRLVTQGLLTDVAESSQIRVRRGDLPRKPGHSGPYPLLRTA